MKKLAAQPPSKPAGRRLRPGRFVALALLGLASQAGCGREFYREWANQDVSEAVFEKSRDPRFRLDLFSIDPPALSRFADPYDQDRPPAPPDDYATEAMSPVPQWPDHRLIMPVEGTGYLKLLDEGPRYSPPAAQALAGLADRRAEPDRPRMPARRRARARRRSPRATRTRSRRAPRSRRCPDPARPGENSGPGKVAMSPTYLAANASPVPPTPANRTGAPKATGDARSRRRQG